MDLAESNMNRKRLHMPPVNLQESLDRLHEVSARLEVQLDRVPEALRPFVELVQTQTAALEALIISQRDRSEETSTRRRTHQPKLQEETRIREFALEARPTSRCRVVEKTTRTIFGLESASCEYAVELKAGDLDGDYSKNETPATSEVSQGCTTKRQLRPSPLSKAHNQGQQTSLSQTVESSKPKSSSTPSSSKAIIHTQDIPSTKPSKRPTVLSIQIPQAPPIPSVSPLTPDRSWYFDQTPIPIPSRIQSWRYFPPVDISSVGSSSFVPPVPAISLEHLEQANRALEEPKSRRSSLHSTSSTSSCQSCSAVNKISDVTSESHVQEALRSLISSMKERKKVPVGPLRGGEFGLYSSDYENYHCVHSNPGDSNSARKMLFYDKNDILGSRSKEMQVSPPKDDEVAMELIVDPGCHLFVEPFKPPKHAGWVWRELKATRATHVDGGDGEQKTKVEIMFLGNGFLKLKIRLSDLLGRDQKEIGKRDRFIEFAGIWRANKQDLSRCNKEKKGERGSMELMVVRMPSGKASAGIFSGGLSRFDDGHYNIENSTLLGGRVNEFPSRFLLSPISPL